MLRFEVDAPGQGLATQATFVYAEWYRRVAQGWRLARYQFDYVDRLRGARLGYHWHSVGGRHWLHHAHCEERLGKPAADHYRAYEVDLLEAHQEFVSLYAAEQPVDCSGLRPLN